MQKSLEAKWAEYHFNACGHRDRSECGTKPPGVYRVVLIGSSLVEGFTVSQDQSFAAVLPELLSQDTGKKVEVYNEGMEWGSPRGVDLRINEALGAKPDLILWPVTPWDIQNVNLTMPLQSRSLDADNADAGKTEAPRADLWHRMWAKITRKRSLAGYLNTHSRAFFMFEHLLYKSDSIYLGHSLAPDEYTSSMQDKPSENWQKKLTELNSYVADVANRCHARGVPFVVVAIPRHAQAVMIASDHWPPNLNPYSFGNQIQSIVQSHGGIYIDILHDLRNTPDANSWFYPVDQHLTVIGHEKFAAIMAKEMTKGALPPLTAQPQQSAALVGTK